jgi:hypothetical protein
VERLGTLPESARIAVHQAVEVAVEVVVVEEDVQVVEAVEEEVVAATTVVNRATCLVTALKVDLVVVAAAVVAVTVHVTTVEKLVTSHASVLPRWVEVEAAVNGLIHESVTIAMVVDIYHVIVQSPEKAPTEAAWSVTSVMRWDTLLVTALTPAVAPGDRRAMVVSAVVVVVAAAVVVQMCAVTTVTRWGTSPATVRQLHRKLAHNLWQLATSRVG